MGIISDLVRMKSEKDVQAKQGAIDAVKVVLTDPNATPEAREWATGSLTDLLDNHFHGKSGGGAGGSKSSGRGLGNGPGGQGEKHTIGSIFKGILGGIGHAAQAANPYTASNKTKEQVAGVAASRPQKLELTPEEQAEQKGKLDEQAAAIAQKIAVQKQAALARQKIVDDQEADDAAAKESDKLGLVGDQRLEFIAQHKITPTPKDNTTERQEWVDAKGESHTTYRSPGTGKVVDEDTNVPVDLAQKKLKEGWKAAQKETPDVAPLRSKEERLKVEHPDWPADKVKIEAAKALDKEEADKAKNAQTRLNITVQNAAQNSIPAKPEVTNYWANYIYGGGQIPYGELRNLGRKAVLDIMSMVPQIAAQRGETTGDLVARQSDVKALTASLNKMEPAYAATKAFEQTARANLDRAIGAASKIVDSGSPWINRPWREAEKELLGKPEYAAFHAARVVAFTEVSKVLNNPQGSGAVSDSARKEAEGALGEGATLEQLQAAADILKQDMTSRITAMEDTIKATKARIAGGASAPGGGKGEDKEYNGHTYHRDNPGDSWKLVK